MADQLRPIPIQELRTLETGYAWQIDQAIAGLTSLTPVRGNLHVWHQGTVLEVKGQAETIITLCCDRCLQHFNHALSAQAEELLWLGEAGAEEGRLRERDGISVDRISVDGISVDGAMGDQLDPRGNFDPERWVFEQLSLQLPLVNHCGSECPGPPTWSSQAPQGDPRWAALGQINL